jgi:chromosome segregation ATPase
MTRRCSDAEERCTRSQEELNQVTEFLDGARAMNSSLQSKLDMEKKTHEVTRRELQIAYSMLSVHYQEFSHPQEEIQRLKDENQTLLSSRNNLDKLYRDATDSLTTLRRSHQFTMEELERKRNELKGSQEETSVLSSSLSTKNSIIRDLQASKKFLSQELDTAKRNIQVLEGNHEVLKAGYDKAMDKAIRAGRLLMKRPGVVVSDDIVADVLAATVKTPAPSGPRADSTPRDAPKN